MTENGFRIAGADGPIDIPPREFYFNTKARCRRMVLNHLSRGARQVHACLELATMGWQQELAVIQDKNGRRNLTTTDISRQTELDPSDVRTFLVELEEAGLAERRGKENGSLHKGSVGIYSWAEPRTLLSKSPEKEGARTLNPGWIPDTWKPLIAFAKRKRIQIAETNDGTRTLYLAEGERLARALESLENEVARFLKGGDAQDALYKEERTERTIERTDPPPPPFVNGSSGKEPEPPKAEEEDGSSKNNQTPEPPSAHAPLKEPPTFEEFISEYPPERLDEAKAKRHWDGLTESGKDGAIAWLKLNRNCPRWRADNGRWIPLASTFLRERQFLHPPPPAIENGGTRKGLAPFEEVLEMMRKQREGT